MPFHLRLVRPALIAAAGVSLFAPVAHADQTIVATMSVDGPQLRAMLAQMSPEQRSAMSQYGMGGSTKTTAYISGKKVRTDSNGKSLLLDPAASTLTVISTASHTYTTRPYNPAQASQTGATATITDAGDQKVILGHIAHHYKMTIVSTSGPMAGAPIKGELWAAADIPQPPTLPMAGPTAGLQSQLKKVKGFPLLVIIAVPNSPTGPLTVKTTVTSISNTRLPASTFTIPAGYKKTAAGAGMGMPGMPGGM